jgi:REP element-mobilizing transposase RayT
LETTKAEHMLYATRLTSDSVFALVFDAETPFSTIRSQVSELLNELNNQPATQEEESALDVPPITNILTDIPSPNPEPASTHDFKLPHQQEPFDPNQTRVSEPLSNAAVFNREASPSQRREQVEVTHQHKSVERSVPVPTNTILDDVEVTAPSRPQQRPETPVAPPKPGEVDATRESPSTAAAKKLIVEPITAGLYNLTYACLLVPRFSTHFITGDLADHLSEWMPNICVAFGWRLEFLAVRPDYLQWVANVQPSTSPGYLMRIMRQQTSEKIFADFPRFKKENPSGDFWAPGYLIMGGTQPHPPQLVRDYIQQTRQRQGLEDNSK